MTSTLLQKLESIKLNPDDPEEILTITGVSWEQYEQLLDHIGDSSRYRITYLDGTLEIMSPSRRHEISKKNIGRLLEVYLEEAEIDFWGLGSTTFRKHKKEAGKEPDDCYCIGTEKEFPDLAIEVVITSGGTDTLEVYKRLGVKEVWFWQNNQINVYQLSENGDYKKVQTSFLFPDLDLTLLAQYVTASNPRLAVREYREKIRSRLEK